VLEVLVQLTRREGTIEPGLRELSWKRKGLKRRPIRVSLAAAFS
jgi:hypothetical protein